jgi:hypothetical protein
LGDEQADGGTDRPYEPDLPDPPDGCGCGGQSPNPGWVFWLPVLWVVLRKYTTL